MEKIESQQAIPKCYSFTFFPSRNFLVGLGSPEVGLRSSGARPLGLRNDLRSFRQLVWLPQKNSEDELGLAIDSLGLRSLQVGPRIFMTSFHGLRRHCLWFLGLAAFVLILLNRTSLTTHYLQYSISFLIFLSKKVILVRRFLYFFVSYLTQRLRSLFCFWKPGVVG